MNDFFSFMSRNWAWILSVSGLLVAAFATVFKRIKALQLGVQALLRAQMVDSYHTAEMKGYAPLYARESFENLWLQYKALNGNGVMTDIRAKFLALPTHEDPKQ